MNQQTEKPISLTDTLPAFATELRQLLVEKGEPELATQVPRLMMRRDAGTILRGTDDRLQARSLPRVVEGRERLGLAR
jgi:hypothetical protein